MKSYHRSALVICLVLVLAIIVGCAPKPVPTLPKGFEPTCIQGKVQYRSPDNATPLPFPYASITAWRHKADDQPLAKTKSDKNGNYCIEVPLGSSKVDLRIWELKELRGTHYMCKVLENNISPEMTSKKCGEGCMEFDIAVDCRVFLPDLYSF